MVLPEGQDEGIVFTMICVVLTRMLSGREPKPGESDWYHASNTEIQEKITELSPFSYQSIMAAAAQFVTETSPELIAVYAKAVRESVCDSGSQLN